MADDPESDNPTPTGDERRQSGTSPSRPRIIPASQHPSADADREPTIIDIPATGPSSGEPLRADRSYPDPGDHPSSNLFGSMFGPQKVVRGRVRIVGCSPGCLVISLLVSVILTLLLNALF